MITRVFGKKIENVYDVIYNTKQVEDNDGKVKTVYTEKPQINKTRKVREWSELCSSEGEPRYNNSGYSIVLGCHYINISENETVKIEDEIFRADLNEMHLHTDKIIEEKEVNKEDALSILDGKIKAFNKMMIESNDRLRAYCDLHKLSYEDTDCIELFKLVFPNDKYVINDGVMKAEKLKVATHSPYTYTFQPYDDSNLVTKLSTIDTALSTIDTALETCSSICTSAK